MEGFWRFRRLGVSGVDGVSRFSSSRHLINKLSIEDFGILGFRVGRDDGRPRA